MNRLEKFEFAKILVLNFVNQNFIWCNYWKSLVQNIFHKWLYCILEFFKCHEFFVQKCIFIKFIDIRNFTKKMKTNFAPNAACCNILYTKHERKFYRTNKHNTYILNFLRQCWCISKKVSNIIKESWNKSLLFYFYIFLSIWNFYIWKLFKLITTPSSCAVILPFTKKRAFKPSWITIPLTRP